MTKRKTLSQGKRRKLDAMRRSLKATDVALAARRLDQSIEDFRRQHRISRDTLNLEISV